MTPQRSDIGRRVDRAMNADGILGVVGDQWRVALDRSAAAFTAVPPPGPDDAGLGLWRPRVCPGVGFGIPLDHVASLAGSIRTVLSHPAYRFAARTDSPVHAWSKPGIDLTEQVAYLRGPVLLSDRDGITGYRLSDHFRIAFPHLLGLHCQLRIAMRKPGHPERTG